MPSRLLHTTLTLLICTVSAVGAATIHVDNDPAADFTSIQQAIDASQNGDTVVVNPGTYYETIDFEGKAITLCSTDPNDWSVVEATIIDANAAGSCVTFKTNEDPNTILEGLTLTNGTGTLVLGDRDSRIWYGGGVYAPNASPTIKSCLIRDNFADSGAGVYLTGRTSISSCIIVNNYATASGGAVMANGSSKCRLANCRISNNSASDGGGLYSSNSYVILSHCTVAFNTARRYGSAAYFGPHHNTGKTTIKNCSILSNSGKGAMFVAEKHNLSIINATVAGNTISIWNRYDYDFTMKVTGSNLWDNWLSAHSFSLEGNYEFAFCTVRRGWGYPGSTSEDPLLTPDGHLRADSPCINAGDPNISLGEQSDTDGEPRVIDGRIDIGADEFSDRDNDRLPDWFEQKYFDSETAADPSADPDADNRTTLIEYENYSTDPLTAAKTYYVNAADGNDLNDGLTPTPSPDHGPKKTIQAAIDAAQSSDWVVAAPGRYPECIDFKGKRITVRSTDPQDWNTVRATIIDAAGQDPSAVTFENLESPASVFEGFTVFNGRGLGHRPLPEPSGGAIFCKISSPTVRYCHVTSSNALYHPRGGGIATFYDCQARFSNCLITELWRAGNECRGTAVTVINYEPGGVGVDVQTKAPVFTNCTIVANEVDDGYYQVFAEYSAPTFINCIINTPNRGHDLRITDPSKIYNSCIGHAYLDTGTHIEQLVLTENGNFHADPCFVIAEEYMDDNGTPWSWDDYLVPADHHLKSAAGRWDPNSARWVRDSDTSPAIDAGDPNSAWLGERWPHGSRMNLGAYAGTAEASLSPYAGGNPADLDANGKVDARDGDIFASHWLSQSPFSYADLNNDRISDFQDFAVFANAWSAPVYPGRPRLPYPPDGSKIPESAINLTWTPSHLTDLSRVYLAAAQPLEFLAETTDPNVPVALEPGTQYFWRVDSLRNDVLTTGRIWSFITAIAAPVPTYPADEQTGVKPRLTLTWSSSPGADHYNLYLGTTDPPQLNQTIPAAADPTVEYYLELDPLTQYYWRLEAANTYETVQTPTQTFTTGKPGR